MTVCCPKKGTWAYSTPGARLNQSVVLSLVCCAQEKEPCIIAMARKMNMRNAKSFNLVDYEHLRPQCEGSMRTHQGEDRSLLFPVERQLHDFGGDFAVADLDLDFLARLGIAPEHVSQADARAHERRLAPAGHDADYAVFR